MSAPPRPPQPPAPRSGLSLYDNIVDPNDKTPASATISSAPLRYDQTQNGAGGSDSAKKSSGSALYFQPIKRPQAKQPPKPKAAFPKPIPNANNTPSTSSVAAAAAAATQGTSTAPSSSHPQKSTLADWAATEDDEWRYGAAEKHQRGGRKKKKRKQQEYIETNWDDIYDPSRPTDVEEYMRSDEKIAEVREWKNLLHGHKKRLDESDMESSDDEAKPSMSNQFAPPPSFDFAPPPPSPPAQAPKDREGDDAYTRRAALSQNPVLQDTLASEVPPAPTEPPHIPPPPPPSESNTISAAPIRYAPPDPPHAAQEAPYRESPADAPTDEGPRSSRPGQAGFAQRLMSKYGWTAGEGLGVSADGIVNPLRVQVDKRRKKADADGGGWAEPGGKGKILGGRRREGAQAEGGKFGVMSEVIVLQNMLEDMPDLEHEISEGLGQEIGEECGEKYGRVERLYIDQTNRQVFIKFTDQVSALRAVNELDGRVFNGNTITSRFYDTERFERGQYNT